MTPVEVTVAGGAETIRVEPSPRGIMLTNGGRWSQALTRAEAWRLAHASDPGAPKARDPD